LIDAQALAAAMAIPGRMGQKAVGAEQAEREGGSVDANERFASWRRAMVHARLTAGSVPGKVQK
jgi:hypothetical protein